MTLVNLPRPTSEILRFASEGSAVVIGSSGGIGQALTSQIAGSGRFATCFASSRTGSPPQAGVSNGFLDVEDEDSIAAFAAHVAAAGPVSLVLVATGLLRNDFIAPEKSYRALDPQAMAHSYRVNAIGPALVAKHFLPLMAAQGKTLFGVLSARVSSIGDNRLGGWYSYRASKAALNMLVCNLAIEHARRRPEGICVGLHPGTVDTALSRPFQTGVPKDHLFTPATAANHLLSVADRLTPAHSGRLFAWNGDEILP